MNRMLGVVAALLGVAACADSPVEPSEPWGTYDYEAIGFDGGWFEIAPDGGSCEIVRFDVGAWSCVVTDVAWTADSIAFRFAPPQMADYYYQHEGTAADGRIVGEWHLVAPTIMPYAIAGRFEAVLRD